MKISKPQSLGLIALATLGMTESRTLADSNSAGQTVIKSTIAMRFSVVEDTARVVIVSDVSKKFARARVTVEAILGCQTEADLAVFKAPDDRVRPIFHDFEVVNTDKKACFFGDSEKVTLDLGTYIVDAEAEANRFTLNGKKIADIVIVGKSPIIEDATKLPPTKVVNGRLSWIKLDAVYASNLDPFYTADGRNHLRVDATATSSNKCFLPTKIVTIDRTRQAGDNNKTTREYTVFNASPDKICPMIADRTPYTIQVVDAPFPSADVPLEVEVNGKTVPVHMAKGSK